MIGRFHLRNVTWVIFTASANFNSRIRSSNFTRCIPSYQKIHGFSVSPSKSQKQQRNTKNQRSLPPPCFAPPPLPDPPLGRGWRRRVWCSWSPAIEEWIHRKRIPKRITEPTWTNMNQHEPTQTMYIGLSTTNLTYPNFPWFRTRCSLLIAAYWSYCCLLASSQDICWIYRFQPVQKEHRTFCSCTPYYPYYPCYPYL